MSCAEIGRGPLELTLRRSDKKQNASHTQAKSGYSIGCNSFSGSAVTGLSFVVPSARTAARNLSFLERVRWGFKLHFRSVKSFPLRPYPRPHGKIHVLPQPDRRTHGSHGLPLARVMFRGSKEFRHRSWSRGDFSNRSTLP